MEIFLFFCMIYVYCCIVMLGFFNVKDKIMVVNFKVVLISVCIDFYYIVYIVLIFNYYIKV